MKKIKAIYFDKNYYFSLVHPVYKITFIFVERVVSWDDDSLPF